MNFKNLTHHLLIATPQIPDDRFERSVIYIFRHDEQGALGLIINKQITNLSVYKLFENLDILLTNDRLKDKMALDSGPVHPEVGFMLHTGQPTWESSFAIAENICITTSLDILKSIGSDTSSTDTVNIHTNDSFHLCLGHSSWTDDQLLHEIQYGDWLVCPATLELLFNTPFESMWQQAGKTIDINLDFLTDEIGNA